MLVNGSFNRINRSRTRKKKQVTQTARYRNYFSSYDWCERNARNAPRPDLIRYLWRFDVIFDSTSARVPFLLAPRSSFASRSVDARTSVIETSRSRVMNRNYQRCVSITVSIAYRVSATILLLRNRGTKSRRRRIYKEEEKEKIHRDFAITGIYSTFPPVKFNPRPREETRETKFSFTASFLYFIPRP